VAQCFQLVFGGQEQPVAGAPFTARLASDLEGGYLTYEEYSNLAKAAFSAVLHRSDTHGRQIHELPTDVDELATLARKMDCGHDAEGLATVPCSDTGSTRPKCAKSMTNSLRRLF
jgi:glutamine synthetase adenylyltransferase